jgi:hypothetical protein
VEVNTSRSYHNINSGCIRSFVIYCSRVRPTCNPNYCVKGTGRPYVNMININKMINIVNINNNNKYNYKYI